MNRRIFAWLLGAVSMVSSPVFAASLDQLAAMQTVMRSKIDGFDVCGEVFQGVSSAKISRIPQRLEAHVQEKWREMTPEARIAFFSLERTQACSDRCRCGMYANWIGESEVLTEKRDALLAREKKSPLSEKRVAACAKANAEWVCHHPILRSLLKEDE